MLSVSVSFLADRTQITIELLSWLSWVRRPSACNECTVAIRWKIEPRLLLITNRKSRTGFQMTYRSMTSDDLEGHSQPVRSAILATAGLLVIFLYTMTHCHVAVPSSTTLATIRCQSNPSSEALMSCDGLTLSFHDSHKLSRYFSFWRPCALPWEQFYDNYT